MNRIRDRHVERKKLENRPIDSPSSTKSSPKRLAKKKRTTKKISSKKAEE